jgi:hypothetical protein
MHLLTHTIERGDDEIDIEIEYTVSRFYPAKTYGPPEHCSPAEGGDVETIDAFLDGAPLPLTDAERAQIEARIYDTHDHGC